MGILDDLGGLVTGGSGGGSFESLLPLLLLEGVKGGFGVLEGQRESKLADKASERSLEARLEIQKISDEAALERLREQIEQQLQVAQINSLSADKRGTQANKSRVTQSLINAAVQGGAGQANSLLGIPRAVGDIRVR